MMPCPICDDCPIKEVRVITQRNGVKQYTYQCTICGEQIGLFIPHTAPDILRLTEHVPFDYAFRQDMRQRRRENIVMTERFQAYYADWREIEQRPEYYTYIQSREWKIIRNRVMERAQHQCEGCGQRYATEVHHLTYIHLGHEFLWELVAVCRDCHARFHGKDAP